MDSQWSQWRVQTGQQRDRLREEVAVGEPSGSPDPLRSGGQVGLVGEQLGAVGLLGLGLVLGPVPVATAVGGMVARRASPFTHFLVAAPLVVAMPFVPIVGWPILAVVVITGLGAWVRGIRPRRRVPRPAPVPNQP